MPALEARNWFRMCPKHPHIIVRLSDQDGNAFMILGMCRQAAKEAGLTKKDIQAFYEEATSGDYDHLIKTAARWFACE